MDDILREGFVVAAEAALVGGAADVSDALQSLIDENPNRTIYLPDGTYLLAKPIFTPASPERSVDLRLSNYAVLKASEDWDGGALVRLGGKLPANDIRTPGSNYSLTGGIIDGSGVADGVSVDGGRETAVREVSIKRTRVGLHIKRGANSGSSDADVFNVNIVGNGALDSVGVLVEGYDNTFTNMRIADVFIGVELRSAGNSMRNLHPLYTCKYENYGESCGFLDTGGNNWYNFCYSDHFATGFRSGDGVKNIYDSCFCMWYSPNARVETVFSTDGEFNSAVTNLRVGFQPTADEKIILNEGRPGGRGVLERIFVDPQMLTGRAHERYLTGGLI